MTNTRTWVVAGVLVVIAVLVLGGLLGIKPQLDAAHASDSQRESVETLNFQRQKELAALKEQNTHVDEIAAQVASLRASVPASLDLDTFTGELSALATEHGVTVTSYAPQDPVMFVPSEEIAAKVPATIDATNFAAVTVAVTVTGSRDATLAFVGGLQSGSRLVLVNGVTVSEDVDGTTTTTIAGLVYVLFDEPIVDPAAVETAAPPTEAVAAN